MIELLRAAAAQRPDHQAVITTAGGLTYAELLRRAEAAAEVLVAKSLTRFAVLDPDASVVWPLLAASSLSGVEVCVYPVAAPADTVERLRRELEHDVIVTSRPLPGAVLPENLFAGSQRFAADPADQRRLLVLTTGTSGHPKAARHDWERIVHVTRRIVPTPHHRWLLAYALNQFGGLQVLLHVAAAQATVIAPESFQPRDALRALREHDVSHASGSPTFWRFLTAEIRAGGGPVPSLQQITLSGEAVPPSLIDQLRGVFPDARISQIYAATEIGQGVTVRDGQAGMPTSVLDAVGELRFKIVDGQLWVSSGAAMLGYAGQEEAGPDDWRPTGDLVEVVGDRIEFLGRTSAVVNVGGVKVHPFTVEDRVSRVPGVALAQAYGRPNAMVGSIVAVDVVPDAGADQQALRASIREACEDLPPAARPRSVKFVETLDTRGSKLLRRGGE